MDPFTFTPGSSPLLVSMPHSGTYLPPDLEPRLTQVARTVPDTDWHIPELYNFLGDLGAGVIAATHSRYVIDMNRPPDGKPLYPGASNTELCPTTTFGEDPIYREGQEVTEAEVAERCDALWRPYHEKITSELAVLKERHGYALLWDAHSIASEVPRFFEGRLPDLNLGTGNGSAADAGLLDLLTAVARDAEESLGFTHAINGRFKGGYITRHHGRPAERIHAVQLELSQITYMNEAPPYAFREDLAEKVRPVLSGLLSAMLAWGELEMIM